MVVAYLLLYQLNNNYIVGLRWRRLLMLLHHQVVSCQLAQHPLKQHPTLHLSTICLMLSMRTRYPTMLVCLNTLVVSMALSVDMVCHIVVDTVRANQQLILHLYYRYSFLVNYPLRIECHQLNPIQVLE